ncbi:Zeta toxin [Actinoalloteichus sp. AHMU CJ021]|uniref:AAA family ATPase n=1 Tax=Actinoalloteichus cyanogriseus TaxID=2893586 RepID=UPI0006862D52|nr:AAA family ATPase [Actinoalloteichus caeruleus]AUS80711.1 Zeta toxin [Actinoalloteichus sp. AHMU CJ021]
MRPASPELTEFHAVLTRNDLVVVAGLPGAGKSTLLRNAENTVGAVILDSDQMRSWLGTTLPSWVGYRWYRPLVHLCHHARIAVFCALSAHPVVAHEPATRISTRVVLLLVGALTGRTCHFVWVTARVGEALEGQRARGRVLGRPSFAHHVRRARRVERALLGGRIRGWRSVTVLRRPDTGARLVLRRR